MRILAGDIGGTYARFAECRVGPGFRVQRGPVFAFPTRQPGVASFGGFWQAFREAAPAELADTAAFDAVALGLAGHVTAQHAVLPNIDWNIGPRDLVGLGVVCLLNDFHAQGHALAVSGTANLEAVHPGSSETGAVAIVGAGTGLGHCALHPVEPAADGIPAWQVAGSEAGHASFAFRGDEERELESRMLAASGRAWLSNDDVVSGPGAALLHRALTGQTVTPAEALAGEDSLTVRLFSRFLARACRNYCLNVFPVSRLVLSGGLAARRPQLVRLPEFREEFTDGFEYREALAAVPVWLNTDQEIGLDGAAVFGALRLAAGSGKAGGA